MAAPVKNNKAAELLQSFQVMEQKLTSRGLKPKLMTLEKGHQIYSRTIYMTNTYIFS
jgi:hypothetical protein